MRAASFELKVGNIPATVQGEVLLASIRARLRFAAVLSKFGDGEGTRGAVEARGDGAAAFSDRESPACLAYRLCRASSSGFDSGRVRTSLPSLH